MTATLPGAVQQVMSRFITTEYTTVDATGQPITWPVTPYYRPGEPHVDITTGLGYPKKADDARANPRVSLLFSDPTGSELEQPPAVLVQGTATVDDHDLDANRRRFERESSEKVPGSRDMLPPQAFRRLFGWYFTRIYVHVRPERVFVWQGGDFSGEPELFDSRIEEIRSGHSEEPEVPRPPTTGGAVPWEGRLSELGRHHPTAVLSLMAPDGFPMSVRLPIEPDQAEGRIRLGEPPLGLPLAPGRACLTAHDHDPELRWQRNFQVRGDLVPDGDAWSLVPHRIVGGMESPPVSQIARFRLNARKALRFRRTAKQRLAQRRLPKRR